MFNPALLWLLVAVPVLIHLINMLRHRRVEWAAMEFLLASQKKHRTWIVLKQLLLLLARMGAVALLVLIVFQPGCSNRWGKLLGTTKTHHIVLLDDSFSMSERWGDTSAFAEAKKVVEELGDKATEPTQPQKFTLLRFSQLARLGRDTPKADDAGNPATGAGTGADAEADSGNSDQPVTQYTRADFLEKPVNRTDFLEELTKKLDDMQISESSAGPLQALDAVDQLLGEDENERRVVYVVSDFRARDWNDPTELQKQLLRLNEAEVDLHLVNCVDRTQPNLAITSLAPAEGICAAGVPLFMEVTVRNYGERMAREVAVLLEENGETRPAVTIPEIPPGGEVTDRFLVLFPVAGEHELVARLDTDPVMVDNFRYGSVDLPSAVSVLMVDGDAEAFDARFLSVASAPGGTINTGIQAQIETPRFLSLESLDKFQAVNVANFDRLDPSAVGALEQYVAGGGGVAIFLGPLTDTRFMNDALYRDGEGLFPLPLDMETELLVDRLQTAPDVEVEPHFIFRIFEKERNTFLNTVTVERYFAAAEGWQPAPDSGTRVIARLRNGAPLVVEKAFGEGRVIAFLTTAAPLWNNWARNPSFVVLVQDLQAYLARRPTGQRSQLVGVPLQITFNPDEYQSQVRFESPTLEANGAVKGNPTLDGRLQVALPDTFTSGFYRARLTRKADGTDDIRHHAYNVDPEEGDLEALGGEQLAARLGGVKYQYAQASSFTYNVAEDDRFDLTRFVLYALVLLLVGEQILAWLTSYHPPLRRVALAQGGAR